MDLGDSHQADAVRLATAEEEAELNPRKRTSRDRGLSPAQLTNYTGWFRAGLDKSELDLDTLSKRSGVHRSTLREMEAGKRVLGYELTKWLETCLGHGCPRIIVQPVIGLSSNQGSKVRAAQVYYRRTGRFLDQEPANTAPEAPPEAAPAAPLAYGAVLTFLCEWLRKVELTEDEKMQVLNALVKQ